ncbi:CGNR zinc finger domain-containing protein [Burkholderia anthina]|uniref:CGNR zinc finger domain-containing protein n=1 Tax=Burkholderia anthina TaxID=179879 RepID=UPI0009BCCEFF|nr:ABATE domain-containing protein [Burkholderia anthina]
MEDGEVIHVDLESLDFIGDHPALDFINTVIWQRDRRIDRWRNDDDVARWLARQGFLAHMHDCPKFAPGALLESARRLREVIRILVTRRIETQAVDVEPLNAFLARGRRFVELVVSEAGLPELFDRIEMSEPEQVLAPVAQSAAQLLCMYDFSRVKKCENPLCTLCFVDGTEDQNRRWCSAEWCGRQSATSRRRPRHQRY